MPTQNKDDYFNSFKSNSTRVGDSYDKSCDTYRPNDRYDIQTNMLLYDKNIRLPHIASVNKYYPFKQSGEYKYNSYNEAYASLQTLSDKFKFNKNEKIKFSTIEMKQYFHIIDCIKTKHPQLQYEVDECCNELKKLQDNKIQTLPTQKKPYPDRTYKHTNPKGEIVECNPQAWHNKIVPSKYYLNNDGPYETLLRDLSKSEEGSNRLLEDCLKRYKEAKSFDDHMDSIGQRCYKGIDNAGYTFFKYASGVAIVGCLTYLACQCILKAAEESVV